MSGAVVVVSLMCVELVLYYITPSLPPTAYICTQTCILMLSFACVQKLSPLFMRWCAMMVDPVSMEQTGVYKAAKGLEEVLPRSDPQPSHQCAQEAGAGDPHAHWAAGHPAVVCWGDITEVRAYGCG